MHWQHIGRELPIARHLKSFNAYHIDFIITDAANSIEHEDEVLALIRSDPNVKMLSQNSFTQLDLATDFSPLTPSDRARFHSSVQSNRSSHNDRLETISHQDNAPWNLRQLSADVQFPDEREPYYYIASAGAGVDVYILDTGIHYDLANKHSDRFSYAPTFIGGEENYVSFDVVAILVAVADRRQDLNGHGTHVAGIVGSALYGVCKSCNIISVKVANKTGQLNSRAAVDGIEWVLDDNKDKMKKTGYKGAVINASWATVGKESQDNRDVRHAVNRADSAGIALVAAAGNTAEDPNKAELYPALSGKAISVAGSLEDRRYYSKSGWGDRVDIIAPASVPSYYVDENINLVEGYLMTGTSMAAPHVAGVIAIYMGHEGPLSTKKARKRLMANVDKDYIIDVHPKTDNKFVNSGCLKHNPYVDAPHDEL